MLRSTKRRKSEEMNGTRYLLMLALALMVETPFLPPKAVAKTDVIYASYKYVMGDNDTKNDAKRLCFIGAKRRLLEKAGTFIISMSETQNFKLTKDEIISYSAGFLNAEVADEKVVSVGKTLEIVMTLKANIDMDDVKRTLNKIINDAALKQKIEEQNKKLLELENKIKTYKDQLAAASYDRSFELRKERKETLQALDIENEAIRRIILTKRKRDIVRTSIVKFKSQQIKKVLRHIELGMTPQEVKEIVTAIAGYGTFTKDKDKQLYPGIRLQGTFEPGSKSKWARYIWDRFSFFFSYDEYIDSLSLRYIDYLTDETWPMSTMARRVTVVSKDRNILEMTQPKDHTYSHSAFYWDTTNPAESMDLEKAWKYVWGKDQ